MSHQQLSSVSSPPLPTGAQLGGFVPDGIVPGAPSAVPAVFQHFQRDYAVIAVKISRDNKHPDTNSESIVRAIVRENVTAAEWSQLFLSDSPAWLFKLSKRNEAIRKKKGKGGAVILSFGEGFDTLVLLGEAEDAPANSADVPRICVSLSVATAEAESEGRMEEYGFVRPSDGLFEHVTAGIEAARSEQNVRIYLHTDLAKWYPTKRADDEDTRKTAFRLCTSKKDPSTVTRVDELDWGDVFVADPTPAKKPKPKHAPKSAVAAAVNQEKAKVAPSAETMKLAPAAAAAPKPAAVKKASSGKAASKKVASSKSSFDEGWSTGDDEETTGVKAIGYGFRPREFMLLTKAFRGQPIIEEEGQQDMAQSTSREKKVADRIVKKANKELLSIREGAKMDALLKVANAAAMENAAAAAAAKEEGSKDTEEDEEADSKDDKKKARRRPKDSKNKSKEEESPKKEDDKPPTKKAKRGTKAAEEKKESEAEEEDTSKNKRRRSSSKSKKKRSKK